VIRFKHIGPITMAVLNQKILPLLAELKWYWSEFFSSSFLL
jgi:hypothetical protein